MSDAEQLVKAQIRRKNIKYVAGVGGVVLLFVIVFYFAFFHSAYWNGGAYAGKPVYSHTHGISQVAYDNLKACGMSDTDIQQFIKELEMAIADNGGVTVNEVGARKLANGNLVGYSVAPLTYDVEEVDCS